MNVVAARRDLRRAARCPAIIGASLYQRYIKDIARGVESRGRPVSRAVGIGTQQLYLAWLGFQRRIGSFLAGPWIYRSHDVLQAQVARKDMFTSGTVHSVEDRCLASSNHQLRRLTVHRQGEERLFEHPVQIPYVALHVLTMPDQLSGIGIQRKS